MTEKSRDQRHKVLMGPTATPLLCLQNDYHQDTEHVGMQDVGVQMCMCVYVCP